MNIPKRKISEALRAGRSQSPLGVAKERPFNLLIDYAKRHDEIKHIIFDVTDRMTRNDFDKLKIYSLIKEHGKTIPLARSNKVFDKNSGSEEELMLDIEVAVAKKQSNDISRKT